MVELFVQNAEDKIMKITIEDFKEYVAGWLFVVDDFPNNLDDNNMKAALANALSQFDCGQDGIHAIVEHRKKQNIVEDWMKIHSAQYILEDLRSERGMEKLSELTDLPMGVISNAFGNIFDGYE
jgi:hypothetical protein